MKLPHDILQACAAQVLPGCFYYHGEAEQADIELDKPKTTDRIVYLDDKMPYRFVVNKYQAITGVTYSCLLMLLVPSALADTPEVRRPRIADMVDASARLLATLSVSQGVQAVKQVRPAEITSVGHFDRPLDGVTLFLDLTLRGGLNVCLPPDISQA